MNIKIQFNFVHPLLCIPQKQLKNFQFKERKRSLTKTQLFAKTQNILPIARLSLHQNCVSGLLNMQDCYLKLHTNKGIVADH